MVAQEDMVEQQEMANQEMYASQDNSSIMAPSPDQSAQYDQPDNSGGTAIASQDSGKGF